jgi:Glycosyl transferases group 1
MKILAVVSFFPMPQNHGDALRRLMVLKALNQAGELTVAAALRVTTTPADVDALRDALPGARIFVGELASIAGASVSAKIARSIIGPLRLTPPWLYQHWSPTLAQKIAGMREERFDISVLVGESSGLYAQAVSSPTVVWDKSNVLFASDISTLRSRESVAARLRALVTITFSRTYESRILRRANTIWVTSIEEGERLNLHYRRHASAIIPSCVNFDENTANIDPSSNDIAWMSTLNYRPNWDGLCSLLRANGDTLEAANKTLRVIGAGASKRQVRYLARFPFVEYRGFADNLSEALSGVAYAIVPVWSGAGVKLKTLTFMSLGVPVVSTPLGMEGIPSEAATAMFDAPSDFATIAASLTPTDLAEGARRGRSLALSQFSPDVFVSRILQSVSALQPTAHENP